MIDFAILLESYFDCRRHKRSTVGATEFEMHYMENLVKLLDEVNSRQYRIGTSICFVVKYPRYREVFAGQFRDRIIHHYIAMRLEPLMERIFSDRTYNCRRGKGQLAGVKQLELDIREVSENFTKDAWVMKIDLKGFFMSIRKSMLARMVDDFIVTRYEGADKEDLRWLCQLVILHHPEKDCTKKSPDYLWNYLPKEKSLFTNGEDRGVAIGNLFAQLFANFLLNKLDWMVDEYCKHHVRYVDDMALVARDKSTLLPLVPKIRTALSELDLHMNERKFYFQHYSKGVQFTGSIIKPGRLYAVNSTVENYIKAVNRLSEAAEQANLPLLTRAVQSVNSYLGIFSHYNEYATVRRVMKERLAREVWQFCYIKGRFRSIHLKKQFEASRKYINLASEIKNKNNNDKGRKYGFYQRKRNSQAVRSGKNSSHRTQQ